MIIGIVGHPASGKDTASEYLASKGFAHIALGDVIREEMKAHNLPIDRESVHAFAKKRRAELGNAYPSKTIAEKIKAGECGDTVVVSGYRNTEEVRVFQQELGDQFVMIAIDTPIKIRYERAKSRGRIGDDVSFERFEREDEQERAASSGSFEVDAAIAMANTHILNDATKDDFFRKIEEAVRVIKKTSEQNYSIHKIGGILIKDRRLLVCRSKGKDAFIAPGGKVERKNKDVGGGGAKTKNDNEGGEFETPFEALKRELFEEVAVHIDEADMQLFGTFYAPAAYNPENILRMDVFVVKKWKGEPKQGSEVEEIRWINSAESKQIKMGSIFEHDVLPKLKEQNLID